MKKTGWILFFLVTAICAGWVYFNRGMSFGAKLPISSPETNTNMLFIGSSSTADANSYADILKERYPEIGLNKVAMVGAQTGWMLENSEGLFSIESYGMVVVFGGLNDIYASGSITAAKANLQEIYDIASASGSIVVGVTLQPTQYYSLYTATKGQLTEDLNAWIRSNNTLDYVIDLYSMLLGPDGLQNTYYFQPDNLHLTYEGQLLIANEIDNMIFV